MPFDFVDTTVQPSSSPCHGNGLPGSTIPVVSIPWCLLRFQTARDNSRAKQERKERTRLLHRSTKKVPERSLSLSLSLSHSLTLTLTHSHSHTLTHSLSLTPSLSFFWTRNEGPRTGSRQKHHSSAVRITVMIFHYHDDPNCRARYAVNFHKNGSETQGQKPLTSCTLFRQRASYHCACHPHQKDFHVSALCVENPSPPSTPPIDATIRSHQPKPTTDNFTLALSTRLEHLGPSSSSATIDVEPVQNFDEFRRTTVDAPADDFPIYSISKLAPQPSKPSEPQRQSPSSLSEPLKPWKRSKPQSTPSKRSEPTSSPQTKSENPSTPSSFLPTSTRPRASGSFSNASLFRRRAQPVFQW